MPSAAALPSLSSLSQIQFQPPPHPALRVSVVVPVRDEEEALPAALAALAHQIDAQGVPLDPACYEVLVLANNCRDSSAALARRFGRHRPCFALHVVEATLPPLCANIGTARRLAMDAACRRLLWVGRPGGVIASTDGDVEVARDWLFQTLREFGRGADAVGGCIRTQFKQGNDPEARRYARLDRTYQHGLSRLEALVDPDASDPWPRHHQFFGGSLAVTADAYCRAGGLPAVSCLEDVALEHALARQDFHVRHSPHVRVRTSARQAGRATLGLSTQLRDWGEMGRANIPHLVQQPQAIEVRLRARAVLRHWRQASAEGQMPGSDQIAGLAEQLAVPCSLLHAGLGQPHQPFGALWAQVMAHHAESHGPWAQRWPLWEITRALPDLKARLACSAKAVGEEKAAPTLA